MRVPAALLLFVCLLGSSLQAQIQITITTATPLPNAAAGSPYSLMLQASGGRFGYSFVTASGTLPAGLSLATSGLLSGTPTQTGTFQFTVRAGDCVGAIGTAPCNPVFASKTFSLTVTSPVTITNSFVAEGAVCQPYSQGMTVSGGNQPYTWTAQNLPPGLSISAATGLISGTPSQEGQFTADIRVTDAAQQTTTRSYLFTIRQQALRIVTTSLPSGAVGVPYYGSVTATGGSQLVWGIASGQLPPGLVLSTTAAGAGLVSGTPSAAGTFTATYRVTSAGCNATAALPISISGASLQITTATVSAGRLGTAYSQTLTATGGVAPLTWQVSGGSLPAGLTLGSNGVIAGVPSQAGSFSFTASVRDSQQQTASRSYVLDVTANTPDIMPLVLPSGTVGVAYAQTLTASGGVAPYTWSIATGALPPGLLLNPATGVVSGTPTQFGGFGFTVQVTDAARQTATRQYSVTINTGLTILNTSIPQGRVSVAYQVTFLASGGIGALSWNVAGNVPPGLSMDSATGVFAGTPTLNGDFTFTVSVTDQTQSRFERTFQLSILTGIQITTESLPPGVTGRAYQQTLSATGGVVPYRWIQLTVLPPGLTFTSEGVLSGTPTQAGNYSVAFSVSDSANANASRNYVLTISSPFTITTQALISGTAGANYNQTLSTTGGRAPVTYQLLSGNLPPGVLLAPATGAITGTPSTPGDYTFTIRAIDADQQTAERTFTVTIQGQFRITTDSLPDGEVGTAFLATLASTGGAAPVVWSIAEGTLPDGIALNASTGVLSGTPASAGRFNFTVQAADRNGQTSRQRFSFAIIGLLTVDTDAIAAASIATPYSQSFQASGGEPPYRWSVSNGELPAGLTLDPATGVMSGSPSRAGTFRFEVRVQDRANRSSSRTYTLQVSSSLTVTVTSLPGAVAGVAYQAMLVASGATGALTWSITGALPGGVTLDSASGRLSGTPTAAGAFPFTVTVTDSSGASATRQLTITVAPLTIPPVVITPDNVEPTAQPPVTVTLSGPAPVALTGTVTMTFVAATGGDNPQVRFSNGSRSANFTVAAGQTQASFGAAGLSLQVSNVAGVITLATRLTTTTGLDVTPSPAPSRTVQVPRSAPVITALTARRSGNTLTIEVVGYSSTREVATTEVQFTTASGTNVQGTTANVAVTSAFASWFQDERSPQFGSAFTLTLPFTVTGDAGSITGVSVVLVNGVGRSASRAASF